MENKLKQIVTKELVPIAKKYKTKIVYKDNIPGVGGYDITFHHICLSSRINTKEELISTFFHELGHHYCVTNNLWYAYHHYNKNKQLQEKAIKTALRAEIWIDKWAEKEMKKHYPNTLFQGSYKHKEVQQWFKSVFVNNYIK